MRTTRQKPATAFLSRDNTDRLRELHDALRHVDPDRDIGRTLDLVVSAGLSLLAK